MSDDTWSSVESPFVIEEIEISNKTMTNQGLLVTPRRPMVIDGARLEHLRGATDVNGVERALIEDAKARGTRVLILRGKNAHGQPVWQFDEAFEGDELAEAGYVMSCALLPLQRRLLAAGVILMVHTEWGLREGIAMRDGVARLREECREQGGPTAELDFWILNHMLMHVGLSLDHVVKELLPTHMSMLERRVRTVGELLKKTPADLLS